MKSIRQMTDAEMITTFIRVELASARFRKNMLDAATACNMTEAELSDTNTADAQLATRRRNVLVHARPGIMKTLPTDIVWQEVVLSAEEWSRVQYINDEPWVTFSDNTRLVTYGSIKAMQQPNRTIHRRMTEIQAKQQRGEKIEEIILLTNAELSKMVLVEGHVRATSYLALNQEAMVKIPVMLGISEHPETWSLY